MAPHPSVTDERLQFFASGLNIPYDDLKDWKLLGKGRTAKVFRVRSLLALRLLSR